MCSTWCNLLTDICLLALLKPCKLIFLFPTISSIHPGTLAECYRCHEGVHGSWYIKCSKSFILEMFLLCGNFIFSVLIVECFFIHLTCLQSLWFYYGKLTSFSKYYNKWIFTFGLLLSLLHLPFLDFKASPVPVNILVWQMCQGEHLVSTKVEIWIAV